MFNRVFDDTSSFIELEDEEAAELFVISGFTPEHVGDPLDLLVGTDATVYAC